MSNINSSNKEEIDRKIDQPVSGTTQSHLPAMTGSPELMENSSVPKSDAMDSDLKSKSNNEGRTSPSLSPRNLSYATVAKSNSKINLTHPHISITNLDLIT